MSGEWTARTKDLAKALHLQAAALRNVRIAALAQLSELQVDEHALERLLAEEEGREGQGGGAAGGKGGGCWGEGGPPCRRPAATDGAAEVPEEACAGEPERLSLGEGGGGVRDSPQGVQGGRGRGGREGGGA